MSNKNYQLVVEAMKQRTFPTDLTKVIQDQGSGGPNVKNYLQLIIPIMTSGLDVPQLADEAAMILKSPERGINMLSAQAFLLATYLIIFQRVASRKLDQKLNGFQEEVYILQKALAAVNKNAKPAKAKRALEKNLSLAHNAILDLQKVVK